MASKSGRSQTAKGPSQRQLRVGETLRHALSEILMREDFFDPDLNRDTCCYASEIRRGQWKNGISRL